MKSSYWVRLVGADDNVVEFWMDLTEEEAKVLHRVEQLSKKLSHYEAEPYLEIKKESVES